ncbi:CBS domain-containing protein [Fervidicoccus fontis]|uniref:Inosine-5'-monophosphate dehydrogenase related protein II n=2 Tax=Fervidicoccus fontis TaxID=683846 RepID=H9ZZY2_FERFK|nr:CBS domain-containing protein [Fervidicoccus fontis]AFH42289.1 inosine-5'-monophosphate dehydrogenase related protein II [Fervidicoccus fontis Kam940]MBE9391795.1 CBS domain-containing protein [Fervidicoccus fontis]PMB76747.1 MAG: IMP dehydrogenase [Fervidicoccus fontis]HEW63818.1 CBS domain-containing protein [Fervidicoccus fontis]
MVVKINDYISSPVISVLPSDTLAYARNLMLRHEISRLLVIDEGKLVGILTSSDLLKALSVPEFSNVSWDKILVRDVMSKNVITIKINSSISDAAALMKKYMIGSLAVIDNNGDVVGLITRTDLIKAYADNYTNNYTVKDYMDKNPPTISPFHPITSVFDKIEEKPYYKVIIVDSGKPVGIITKKDIIFLRKDVFSRQEKYIKRDELLEKGRTGGVRYYIVPLASDIMSTNLVTVYPDEKLPEAAKVMIKNKIGSLVVISESNGLLLGLLTKNEIIDAISKL